MFSPLFLTGAVVGIPFGFLAGSLFTRKIMAPDFCPRCLRHLEWQKELKEETDRRSVEEKSESRHFYHLRKRDKE